MREMIMVGVAAIVVFYSEIWEEKNKVAILYKVVAKRSKTGKERGGVNTPLFAPKNNNWCYSRRVTSQLVNLAALQEYLTRGEMSYRQQTSSSVQEVKKILFKYAMKGAWKEVINIYEHHPELHQVRITRSGDTALHIAVSNGREGIVEKLVEIIFKTDKPVMTLKVGNERGDTPLHLAAAMGSVRICKCIAKIDPKLIGARNCDQETPFYVAVLNGRKDAFLCLQNIIGKEKGSSYYRGKDGDTILNSAVNGDHFDLAFQIIDLYPELIDYVNKNGLSPLHILASKPSAFRSGSHLGWYHKIIYICTFVDELRVQNVEKIGPLSQLETDEEGKVPNYPENYQTCIDFFGLFKNAFHVLAIKRSNPTDAESQDEGYHQMFPPNYSTCFEFIKLAFKVMLIILGFGSREIRKVQEKKEKHKWSLQLMNELLERSLTYEYESNGQKPQDRQDIDMPMDPSEANEDDQIEEDGVNNVSPDSFKETLPDSGNKEIPLLIAAINGFTDTMEKMVKLFPSSIHPMKSDKESSALVAAKNDIKKKVKRVEEILPDSEAILDKDFDNKRETPILMAAKNGISEMVEKILQLFPVAIHDVNSENKNVVLLAVENRQPHVYSLLLEKKSMKDSIFRKVDIDGNSALHLAAMLGDYRPWKIPGAALQMQWEIKWYEYVKNSMPLHFFARYNKKGETPKDIFRGTHKDLIKAGGKWLTSTSESCSVVAALIATVAFATSSTVPGGINEMNGKPILEYEPAFDIFAISSLVALCFSVTSLVMFLSILTSRYQEKDFGGDLPRKLLVGLTSLFVSIASVLVSFCAGHFFVLKDKLKYAAFPVYAVTCLPVTFFAMAQFPLYFDLTRATFKKVPQRSYRAVAS